MPNLEGMFCWEDDHGCICGNACEPPPKRIPIRYAVKLFAYVARCPDCEKIVYMVTDEALVRGPRRPSGSSELLPVTMTVLHTCS